MRRQIWQPPSPIECIIFDCDGTLSTIEGIDVLAEHNRVGEEVKALTAEAMGGTGLNLDLYHQRLSMVRPSHAQVIHLGSEYYVNRIVDANTVLQILTRLNKTLYIVSAGLLPSIKIFGNLLKFSESHIFGVDISFDKQGNYLDFERSSPLVMQHGKRDIISTIIKNYKTSAFIGDGLNDIKASDLVTRFIGFGGAFYRKKIEEVCQYYIRIATFTPLLPLLLTQTEFESLLEDEKMLYSQGVEAILQGTIKI